MGLLLMVLLALQAPSACPDVAACRAAAEEAAGRGDFETFHDLAWRAAQKGKPNDPALMLLVARAQSRSGRPGDALVMLGRLADMQVIVDTASPDWDRVRQLAGWAALEPRLRGMPAPSADVPPAEPSAAKPAEPTAVADPSRASTAPASTSPPALDAISFEAPADLGAFALAHDAVSRRFVVGDAPSRRLFIVDDVSRHVVPYVSAASAGFYDELTAMTLDARRGDLWVASAKGNKAGSASVLHKLQLVSGRGLIEVRPADTALPMRLVDLAVTPDGTVLALDAVGPRVFRVRPGAKTLELAYPLDAHGVTALAAADDHVVYVSSAAGLIRVDLAARSSQSVKAVEDLSGFASLVWRNGALVGVQRTQGVSLVVRLALDVAGTHAQPRAILAAATFPIVGTLAGSSFYYLVDAHTIARVAVR